MQLLISFHFCSGPVFTRWSSSRCTKETRVVKTKNRIKIFRLSDSPVSGSILPVMRHPRYTARPIIYRHSDRSKNILVPESSKTTLNWGFALLFSSWRYRSHRWLSSSSSVRMRLPMNCWCLQDNTTDRNAERVLQYHKVRVAQFTLLATGRSREVIAVSATMVL